MCVFVGGNKGLGFGTALRMARMGANVMIGMGCVG